MIVIIELIREVSFSNIRNRLVVLDDVDITKQDGSRKRQEINMDIINDLGSKRKNLVEQYNEYIQ